MDEIEERKKETRSALWLFLVSILLLLLVISQMVRVAYAHKALTFSRSDHLSNNNNNNNLQNALVIPNHKISWAIYQQLDTQNKALFYEFDAKAGDPFYAQLVIPKIQDHYRNDFHPNIALVGNGISSAALTDSNLIRIISDETYNNNNDRSVLSAFGNMIPAGMSILGLAYEKLQPSMSTNTPNDVFYEPFTQTSYWKAQEFHATIPNDGRYFLAVYVNDAKELGADSKFVLAVGEVEGFTPLDFVTTLPSAWMQTKLFFEDYLSIMTVILIPLVAVIMSVAFLLIQRKHRSTVKSLR